MCCDLQNFSCSFNSGVLFFKVHSGSGVLRTVQSVAFGVSLHLTTVRDPSLWLMVVVSVVCPIANPDIIIRIINTRFITSPRIGFPPQEPTLSFERLRKRLHTTL